MHDPPTPLFTLPVPSSFPPSHQLLAGKEPLWRELPRPALLEGEQGGGWEGGREERECREGRREEQLGE